MPKIVGHSLQQQIPTYYQNTKLRFANQFNRIHQNYQLNNIVLVIDILSASIISRLFTVTELVTFGIVFLERLQKERKKLQHHAIYFITPTQESISRMLKDFQNQKQPKYRKAHVLLTSQLQSALKTLISKSPNFLKKLAPHSFKQFYCQLQIVSDNCLHFNLPYLQLAFSTQSSQEKQMRGQIARKFVDMVAGYPKLHTVRFIFGKENSANRVAERIVEQSAKEIKNYLMKLLKTNSSAIDHKSTDLTIFVVDRSIDVITPIIHGYAYESLLYDIMDENGKLDFDPSKLNKQIFDQIRYRHLIYLMEELPQRLQAVLVKCNDKAKIKSGQVKGLLQQKQKLNGHVELLHRIWLKYQQKQMKQIGQLQLSLATGVTNDGKQTKSKDLVRQIKDIIENNQVLNQNQILRLALLLFICVKVTKQDYQAIIGMFKQEDQKALKNLVAFDVSYDKKISKSTKNIDKASMDRARQLLENKNFSSERFASLLQIQLPKLIEHLKRDKTGSQRKIFDEIVVSASPEQNPLPRFDQKRLICFMCGGLSQSQICSIRRNQNLDSMLLASDIIMTPSSFIKSLKKINILDK